MDEIECYKSLILEYMRNYSHGESEGKVFDEYVKSFITNIDLLLSEEERNEQLTLEQAFDVLSLCADFCQQYDEFAQSAALLWKYYGRRFAKFSKYLTKVTVCKFFRVFQGFCIEGIASILNHESTATSGDPLLEQKLKFFAFFLQRLAPTVCHCRGMLEKEQIVETLSIILEYCGLISYFNFECPNVITSNHCLHYLIRICDENASLPSSVGLSLIDNLDINILLQYLLQVNLLTDVSRRKILFRRIGLLKFAVELLKLVIGDGTNGFSNEKQQYACVLYSLTVHECAFISQLLQNSAEESMLTTNLVAIGETIALAISLHNFLELWDFMVISSLGCTSDSDGKVSVVTSIASSIHQTITSILLKLFEENFQQDLFARGWKILCVLSYQSMHAPERQHFIRCATNYVTTSIITLQPTVRKTLLLHLKHSMSCNEVNWKVDDLSSVRKDLLEAILEQLPVNHNLFSTDQESAYILLQIIEASVGNIVQLMTVNKSIDNAVAPVLLLCKGLHCSLSEDPLSTSLKQFRDKLLENFEFGTAMVKVIQALSRQLESYASNNVTMSEDLYEKISSFFRTIKLLLRLLSLYELPTSIIHLLEQFNHCCNKCVLWLGNSLLNSRSCSACIVESIACNESFLCLFSRSSQLLMKDIKENFYVVNQIFLKIFANSKLWEIQYAIIQFVQNILYTNILRKLKLEAKNLLVEELQSFVENIISSNNHFLSNDMNIIESWGNEDNFQQNDLLSPQWLDEKMLQSAMITHQHEINVFHVNLLQRNK